ncbi:hypothetical protein NHX12_018909 [Muraenolepis orangiensis]|uniref:Cytohesin 1 n=1 Tax=Muraenolepis orangiensis TaxID=630683 RepID=A0A9Q0IZ38_9TELE|nr:hypothetical protein NHX12_018909 [Muraenolepis orangiensis]
MDPKKGIRYMVDNKLLEPGAKSFAEFLYREEGLNKTAIGDFLGERDEIHLETLKAFVELHHFSNLNLVQALRQFLWSFRLPGEAQKIDRMMEAFATRYCDCNTPDKTSLDRFVSMNRGINNGGDLPTPLLTKLYESIRSEPFKIPEDDGNDLTHTFFNPDREGWLLKLGGRVKTWKRRWFILTDNCLYYFEYTTFCLEMYNPNSRGQRIKACKTETDGRVVEGKHQASITRDPFYDLVSVRKKKVISQGNQGEQ